MKFIKKNEDTLKKWIPQRGESFEVYDTSEKWHGPFIRVVLDYNTGVTGRTSSLFILRANGNVIRWSSDIDDCICRPVEIDVEF